MKGTKWFAVTIYLSTTGSVWEDIVRYARRVSVREVEPALQEFLEVRITDASYKTFNSTYNALIREAIRNYPNAMRVEVKPMYNEEV